MRASSRSGARRPRIGPPRPRVVIANCGQIPDAFSADAGYFSEHNVGTCKDRGVDAFIAVSRKLADTAQGLEPGESAPSSAQQARKQMRTKLLTERGKAVYARRKCTAEPPFGQIKEARGFRRFSLRGLTQVRPKGSLICTTHNLLKLFRAQAAAATPA